MKKMNFAGKWMDIEKIIMSEETQTRNTNVTVGYSFFFNKKHIKLITKNVIRYIISFHVSKSSP